MPRKEPNAIIDDDDIPPLGEDFFRAAEWLMPAGKSEVSQWLDKDVLDFFCRADKTIKAASTPYCAPT